MALPLNLLISKQIISEEYKIHKTGLVGQKAVRLKEKNIRTKLDGETGANGDGAMTAGN